jgi:sugar lactone lactonase YvrE
MFAGHSMLCPYEENGEEPKRESLVRRLLVFCAVAGAVLAAYAVAQNGSAGAQSVAGAVPSSSTTTTAAGLMANARVVANGVAARALAVEPGAASNGNSAGVLELTLADSPNRVFALAIPAMTSLPAVTSKRGPSAACASVFANGANTNSIKPAHSAQDDGRTGCLASAMGVAAGVGRAGSLGDGGAATSAQLDLAADSLVERSGIAVAQDGTIFIADTQNSTIRSVGAAASSEPGVIRSVAGRWAARQNIALGQPMGIAVDRAGNLYIADYSAGAVDVLSATTGQVSTLAQVVSPASIAATPDGSEVFVASPATGAVFAITASTGSISAVSGFAPAAAANSSAAGPCANVGSTAQGAAASAAACPAGLAADARGDLFVADASGGKIIRVDAKTKKSSIIASGLSVPGAIALDAKGNLFVAEQGASRVLVLPDVTANSGNITLTAPAAFAAPCPQVTDPFTYCNLPSGGTSPTAVFTLTNTSNTQITGIVITPAMPTTPPKTPQTDFTVESTSCTVTLPANGTCLINVAFTPQGSGARTGTLSVTDSNSGDSATYDLAGTGDDYSLQLASGQIEEVNVAQGGTATFKAMVVPDSVFGQNGEMVKFQCPSNTPLFATCSFSPCPVAITPGAAVAFSVMFVTSSATSAAPTVGSCGGSSGVVPSVTRNPTIILRAGPERRAVAARPRFPSLWWLALGGIFALAIFGGGALVIRGGRGSEEAPVLARRMGRIAPSKFAGHDISCPYEETQKGAVVRVRYIFALAGLAVALVIGCHGYKAKPLPTTPVTPTGVTSMTILGNATDASGNPLGTSRSLQVTLDVVTQ